MEEWKDVKGYEGFYQVSNKGRVKALSRKVKYKNSFKTLKEKNRKLTVDSRGYLTVNLCREGVAKTAKVHKLVAIAFLNHTPCGYDLVVDHIDFNKTNNNVYNLRLVTARENANMKHLPSSSKYVGVCLVKNKNKKWFAYITKGKKRINIGYFKNEYDAHLAYQEKLREIENINANN